MDTTLIRILQYIGNKDILEPKCIARKIPVDIEEDSDLLFKELMVDKLNKKRIISKKIPSDLREFIETEDISKSFNINRYITNFKEENLVTHVINTWKLRDKLPYICDIKYLNSVLIYGESGCGKTTLGRYIAYKSELPFIYLNTTNLMNRYLEITGENIRAIFNFISNIECVFMIDEIDTIGSKRDTQSNIRELSSIMISLIQGMDKLTSNNIVIATTNREDILDKALKRRFSNKFEIKFDEQCMSENIISSYLNSASNVKYDTKDIDKLDLNNILQKIKRYL